MNWHWPELRDITIKRKLVLIVMLTTLAALLISTLVYIGNELVSARRQLRGDLSGTAAMLGSTCTGALSFDDATSASQTLAALKAKPWIVAAALYKADGTRLATYAAHTTDALLEDEKAMPLPKTAHEAWVVNGRYAHLWQPIALDGDRIGVIHLAADTEPMAAQIRQQMATSAVVLVVAALIAWLFANRLQRVVSTPVINMIRAMHAVTRDKDYGARAAACGKDELGMLVDGLNGMLGQIEAHVAERNRYSENLEKKVAARTVDLLAAKEAAEAASAINQARDARLHAQNDALAHLVVDPRLHAGDLTAASRLITETAAATLGTERVGIWLFNEDRQDLLCLNLFEASGRRHSAGARLAGDQHPAYFEAMLAARSIVAHDAAADPRTRSLTQDYLLPHGITAMLEATIRHAGRVVGVVCHEHVGQPRRWALDEENFAGSIADLMGLAMEAADRRRSQEELVRAKQRAEEASVAKSRFLANMSHEIRTPMNGILGMAELLVGTELTARQKNFAQAIRSSGEHLLRIINDILDFSRIESGRLELETLNFELRQVLEQSLDLFAEPAARKQIEIALDVPPDVPTAVRGDPSRLRQILMNLIGNAVKFTERGEVVLRVRAAPPEDGHVSLAFEVTDTGIGIAPDNQMRLFQAFTQADTSTTRRFGGSGLGLAISRQLVQLMGGDITLTSAVGKGSTFRFDILLALQPQAEVGAARPETALRGLRALIVDDNATNRQILVNQLVAWGLLPSAVESADKALEELRRAVAGQAPYGLGIFDLHMPVKDGMMLTREIKADSAIPSFPLVMLTSGDSENTVREALSLGINQYVRKPIRQSDLYECLLEVLGVAPGAATMGSTKLEARPAFQPLVQDARILLAEDNFINQEVARAMFERLGCHLEIVDDGRKAVERAMAQSFDLVFMDCQMPEMDGYEATREIRRQEMQRQRRHVPIVALTAHALQGDREKCLAAGMDDYLTKPLQMSDLRSVLPRWLKAEPREPAAPPPATPAPSMAPAPTPMPHREPVGPAPFCRQAVLERCLGDVSLMESLLGVFLKQAVEDVHEIQEAITHNQRDRMAKAAHRLKGAAANLALERIRTAALALEMAGRNDQAAVPLSVDGLEAEVEALKTYVCT